MNDLSATIAGAASVAAMMSTLVLATLTRPAHTPAAQPSAAPPAAWSRASDAPPRALRPSGPVYEDCALLAPAAPGSPAPEPRMLAWADAGARPAASTAPEVPQPDDAADECPAATSPDASGVGGIGSGWIISADGVMQMNPYGLSDSHSITLRPAEPLREFKGRVIGLGAHAIPKDAPRPPETPKPRKPLIVLESASPDHGTARLGVPQSRAARAEFA